MNKSVSSVVGIALLFLTVVFVNGASRYLFTSSYWDLTQEGLYSLSEGTKSVLGNLDSKVTLRFYFSKSQSADVPAIKLYGQRISDLLEEYQRQGEENIQVEFVDPLPDSEDEEWAQRYGLTPMKTPSGNQIFLGLAGTNQQGTEEVIPLFNLSRQETLEYDITKLVLSLGRPAKKKVAILSSLPVQGEVDPEQQQFPGQMPSAQPWYFVSQLKQFAEVSFLETSVTVIPADIDVLMVIHPKKLSEMTQYAIDQFVMRGGNLFLAVDPYSQADVAKSDPANEMMGMNSAKNSNLEKLLSEWGLTLSDGVVGDRLLATKVNAGRGYAEDFLLFLSLQDLQGVEGLPTMNKENVITNDLEMVLLPWAGKFKIDQKEGINVETLLSSTVKSKLYDSAAYQFGGGRPDDVIKKFVASGEQYPLAALLHGKFMSAFPNGKPGEAQEPVAAESSVENTHLTQSSKESYIVAVADTDFLSDTYSVNVQNIFGAQFATRINDNLTFVVNAIENLLGSQELISLRSRGKFMRPFTRVQEIERQAEMRWLEEEKQLQARLETANQRLAQLQRGGAGSGGEMLTQEALDEIKKFREEKIETMRRLREVRRNLREDKQQLGTTLFLFNTFALPVVLVLVATAIHFRRRRN